MIFNTLHENIQDENNNGQRLARLQNSPQSVTGGESCTSETDTKLLDISDPQIKSEKISLHSLSSPKLESSPYYSHVPSSIVSHIPNNHCKNNCREKNIYLYMKIFPCSYLILKRIILTRENSHFPLTFILFLLGRSR